MDDFDQKLNKVAATLDRMAEETRAAHAAQDAAIAKARDAQDAAIAKAREEQDAAIAKAHAVHTAEIAEIRKTNQQTADNIGGFTYRYGRWAEDEFANGIRENMSIGEIKVDAVIVRNKYGDKEFDIICPNGKFVVVGEIKVTLRGKDVVKFAKSLPYFSRCFTNAAGREVVGMVGGLSITEDAEREAKRRGFIILRLKNKQLVADNTENFQTYPQV